MLSIQCQQCDILKRQTYPISYHWMRKRGKGEKLLFILNNKKEFVPYFQCGEIALIEGGSRQMIRQITSKLQTNQQSKQPNFKVKQKSPKIENIWTVRDVNHTLSTPQCILCFDMYFTLNGNFISKRTLC